MSDMAEHGQTECRAIWKHIYHTFTMHTVWELSYGPTMPRRSQASLPSHGALEVAKLSWKLASCSKQVAAAQEKLLKAKQVGVGTRGEQMPATLSRSAGLLAHRIHTGTFSGCVCVPWDDPKPQTPLILNPKPLFVGPGAQGAGGAGPVRPAGSIRAGATAGP